MPARMCAFFWKSKCRYEEKCRYAHSDGRLNEPCKWFASGNCRFGYRCHNLHSTAGVHGASPKWERPKEATFLELKGKTYGGDGGCFLLSGPPEEAEAKVRADPETYLGYQTDVMAKDYVFVLKKGTTFRLYDSENSSVFQLREPQLPTTDEVECFEDDFTSCDTCGEECTFARPGRCEGLKDVTADLCLFSTVLPGDIRQGSLGDCWLMSAMSALAEYPRAVMRMFSPKCLSIDGKYDITLLHPVEDTFVHVVIDDRLPIDCSGQVRYCKVTDADEIWPCLLEKAMAKLFGGYACLNGNHPLIALKAFTQCADLMEISRDDKDQWQMRKPVFKMLPRSCWDRDVDAELAHKEMDWPDTGAKGSENRPMADFYNLLASYDEANYLLCACSFVDGMDDSSTSDLGIVYGHAYAILSVEKDVAGSGFDLMQLRNPWGSGEWRGDWSDNSETWGQHPAVAEALDHGVEDDGQFWISNQDFAKNFQRIYVIRAEMPLSRAKAKKLARRVDTDSSSATPSLDLGKPARRTLNVHVDCMENFDNALKQGMRKARIPESEFLPLLYVIEDSSGSKFPLGSETACSFPVRIKYPAEQMHDELVSSQLRKRLGASGFQLFAKDAETKSEEFLSVVGKFQEYDTDGNGIISEEELIGVLTELMPDRSEDDLRSLFAAADADSDGNIDYEELVAWMYVT